MPKKTGQHNKTSFKAVILIIKKRVNRIWLSCVLDLLFVRRFSCIGCHRTGNALTGIMAGKFVLMWFSIF
jgi:hypothetical protein